MSMSGAVRTPRASIGRVGPPRDSAESPLKALGGRQPHDERRATAGRVGGRHAAAVGVDDARDYRQSKARAGCAARAPALRAPEALEQLLAVVGRQARAMIANHQHDLAALARDADLDR